MVVGGKEKSRQKSEESKENFVHVGALDMIMMMKVSICLSSSS